MRVNSNTTQRKPHLSKKYFRVFVTFQIGWCLKVKKLDFNSLFEFCIGYFMKGKMWFVVVFAYFSSFLAPFFAYLWVVLHFLIWIANTLFTIKEKIDLYFHLLFSLCLLVLIIFLNPLILILQNTNYLFFGFILFMQEYPS